MNSRVSFTYFVPNILLKDNREQKVYDNTGTTLLSFTLSVNAYVVTSFFLKSLAYQQSYRVLVQLLYLHCMIQFGSYKLLYLFFLLD